MSVVEALRRSDYLSQAAKDSGLLVDSLISLVLTAPLRYKHYRIPKRTSGYREIAQPAREVKWLQRWIVERLRDRLPMHRAVAAYEPRSSIKENALRHSGHRFILRMDFRDFFPSILQADIEAHLKRHALSDPDVAFIVRSCMWSRKRSFPLRLCVGAPASPFLSNTVLHAIDLELEKSASKFGATYSRYADDLTFSCSVPYVLNQLEGDVYRIVSEAEYPRLNINSEKTVHASQAGRRVVTGIVLTPSGTLSVGRDRKRLVRAMVHREMRGLLDSKQKMQLEGLINFISSIEPEFRGRVVNWRKKNPEGKSE